MRGNEDFFWHGFFGESVLQKINGGSSWSFIGWLVLSVIFLHNACYFLDLQDSRRRQRTGHVDRAAEPRPLSERVYPQGEAARADDRVAGSAYPQVVGELQQPLPRRPVPAAALRLRREDPHQGCLVQDHV